MNRSDISGADRAVSRDIVLIVAHTTTFLTELTPFGKLMRERARAETIFYCPFVHWTADEFAKACARESIVCLLAPLHRNLESAGLQSASNESSTRNSEHPIRYTLTRILAGVAKKLPRIGMSFMAERLALAAGAAEINHLLSTVRPKLIVLGGDMVGYDTSLYIKLGHQRGIPTLIVPSTMSNGLEQAEVYYGDPNYHVTGWTAELIAALFPKWVMKHKGKRLFRCPPGRIMALELAGLAPPNPWIFNSGAADAIAMESRAMIDYYAEAGMKDDRMVLTGSLSDDAMATRMAHAQQLRERLCRDLGLDPSRPIILTALPPDFLYVTGGRPQCDFQKYEDLISFWIGSFKELTHCNCVVTLHPSVDAASMRYIETDNIRIGSWKTAEMVPVCDIYVASISSTIRWAIACGRPVVNYDVYRYRYTDFLRVPGVLATEEQAEFRGILNKLVNDAPYRASIAAQQRAAAPHWGMLDGRVGDRMLALVQRLASIGQQDATAPAVRKEDPTLAAQGSV